MTEETQPEKTPPEETEELRIPCEIYSRIVGYMRPVSAWNAGKQQEFKDRKEYTWPSD